jgi:putative ABC transport system permease protein
MARFSFRSWLWKPSVAEEVDGEFAFHLEMRTREYVTRGLSPDAARAEALRKFGDVGRANATCRRIGRERDRHMRRREYLSELRQDLVFGVRQLLKNPGFTIVAILTLAIGVGGTTAIFSAVNAVVLRPVPVVEPHRLVYVFSSWRDLDRSSVSPGNFTAWHERNAVFSSIAAIRWLSLNLTEGQTPERVVVARVTGDYFNVLGVNPMLGRPIARADDEPGREDVVVMSHRLWTRAFGSDAGIVGRPIRLSGRQYTVIGVMPAAFDLTSTSEELWIPAALTSQDKATFDGHSWTVLARLKPGVAIEAARAQMLTLAVQLEKEQPQRNAERRTAVIDFTEIFVGDVRQRLYVLLGAVALVLLIACGNVANLLLARGAVRSTELAVRAAMGAGRGRLIRQLFTESLLLAGIGTIAGLVLAYVALGALIALSPPNVPRLEQARIDGATLAFAALVALTSSIAFGLVPAWRAAKAQAQDALRGGRSGGMGASRDRLRGILVAAEVALALLLLVGSGLLIRSALAIDAVNPGFEPAGVLTGRIALPRDEYLEGPRIVQSLERMVERTRAIPGVTHAAVTSQVPMGPGGNGNGLLAEGKVFHPSNVVISRLRLVTPGYFQAMKIDLVAGRDFTDIDRAGALKVTIISEDAARRTFPKQNALGKRVACCEPGPGGPDTPDYKVIVGIARDVRSAGPAIEPTPEFYLPIAQAPAMAGGAWDWITRTMYIVARTPGDPAALSGSLSHAIRDVDPTLPLFDVRTMDERMTRTLATSRFNTILLTTLGVMGLVLSAIGIYGVIAYFVSQRTKEIGVRLALGASPGDVVRLVIRQALKPVLVGLLLGVAGAIAASDVLSSQLYGVTPRDPLTIVAVSIAFVAVAIVASWGPARRASRVDPTRALNAA